MHKNILNKNVPKELAGKIPQILINQKLKFGNINQINAIKSYENYLKDNLSKKLFFISLEASCNIIKGIELEVIADNVNKAIEITKEKLNNQLLDDYDEDFQIEVIEAEEIERDLTKYE